MKIKLNIELNKEELRLLSKQIKIEFANSNRQVTQLLDYKEKENNDEMHTLWQKNFLWQPVHSC